MCQDREALTARQVEPFSYPSLLVIQREVTSSDKGWTQPRQGQGWGSLCRTRAVQVQKTGGCHSPAGSCCQCTLSNQNKDTNRMTLQECFFFPVEMKKWKKANEMINKK